MVPARGEKRSQAVLDTGCVYLGESPHLSEPQLSYMQTAALVPAETGPGTVDAQQMGALSVHPSSQSILAPLMDESDNDELQKIPEPCPFLWTDGEHEAQSQAWTHPGGTVSKSGQSGMSSGQVLLGRDVGAWEGG